MVGGGLGGTLTILLTTILIFDFTTYDGGKGSSNGSGGRGAGVAIYLS